MLTLGLAEAVKTKRYKMVKLLLMLGANKGKVVADESDFSIKAPTLLQMFRAFADSVLCYHIVRAYDFRSAIPLNLFRRAYPEFGALNDIEIDAYFKNKELVTWLLHADELKQIVGLPKDILLLIGSYLTLPDKAPPVTQPLDYRSIANILITIDHIKKLPLKKRECVTLLPDPVVVELKQKMTETLQKYLRGKALYHRQEALDLLIAIEKLWSIQSIYMILTEQRALLSGPPDKNAREQNTIFTRLAARPRLTVHSIFSQLGLQPDYIDTLDACLNHIFKTRGAPAIKKMIDDKTTYQAVKRLTLTDYRRP